jgi:two-component system, OmpR family, alkaline phosphatase synthesis response regulator PhoP
MVETNARILVIDDDGDILELLKYNFEKEGFKVKTVNDSKKTIRTAQKFSPDLIILDVMMPEVNGLHLCEQLRSIPSFENTYIFFLTARLGNAFQHTALDVGGDDYIEKMMGIRSLIYKVNSVLKRKFNIHKRFSEIIIGDMKIDRNTQAVVIRNTKIFLTTVEFELLFFFAQNRERIITIETIVNNIWGSDMYKAHASVELYIDNLRKKIAPDIIKTMSADEYQFGR